MGDKRCSFKVQHKNIGILIFTIIIYIDVGVLKALLNKFNVLSVKPQNLVLFVVSLFLNHGLSIYPNYLVW
jgi:hypothetical protein